MPRPIAALPFLAACLAGCGADVATSAVTTGKLQAQSVEQARSQEAQVKDKLGEAMQAAGAARAEAADK